IAQTSAWREWSEPSTPTMIPAISAPQNLHPAPFVPFQHGPPAPARAGSKVPGGRRGPGRGTIGQTWRRPSPGCDAPAVRPPLFELAAGEPPFLALATAHHERCLRDPELNHPFSHPGQHPQHVEQLAAYWAEVMGGPPRYSQTCGDQSGLLHMHAGNGDLSDL